MTPAGQWKTSRDKWSSRIDCPALFIPLNAQAAQSALIRVLQYCCAVQH